MKVITQRLQWLWLLFSSTCLESMFDINIKNVLFCNLFLTCVRASGFTGKNKNNWVLRFREFRTQKCDPIKKVKKKILRQRSIGHQRKSYEGSLLILNFDVLGNKCSKATNNVFFVRSFKVICNLRKYNYIFILCLQLIKDIISRQRLPQNLIYKIVK